MKIALVTDSASDLPADVARAHKITIISHHIIWGSESFTDLVDITPEAFYERLVRDPVLPKTAHTSVGIFAQRYRDAIQATGAEAALMITVSAKLSGTYNAARAACEMVDFPVRVVDSKAASLALGLSVLATAEACERGISLDDAAQSAEQITRRAQLLFTLNTLEFLHRGGRIGGAQRLIGTALSIRPILGLSDGAIVAIESVRTRKKSLDRLLEIASQQAGKRPLWVGVIHTNAPELAEFQKAVQDKLKPDLLLSTLVSSGVGTYAGPAGLGLGLLPGY